MSCKESGAASPSSDQFHFLSARGFALHPHHHQQPSEARRCSRWWGKLAAEHWQQLPSGPSSSPPTTYMLVSKSCAQADVRIKPLQPLFLGESQVRSAPPWLPLRRSALWPHPRVQPPPASWPWPSLAMGSSRALTCAGCKVAGSHHPRALSGRAEKPIRGSEAALRSVSYPLLILPPPVLFSTIDVHTRLFVTLAKLKRGRGHILMYTTTSPYKGSPTEKNAGSIWALPK